MSGYRRKSQTPLDEILAQGQNRTALEAIGGRKADIGGEWSKLHPTRPLVDTLKHEANPAPSNRAR